MKTEIWAIALVIVGCMIGGFGPILMKKGSSGFSIRKPWHILKNKFLMLGIFMYGISTILFIPALKGGDLSVLYPLTATSYIWILLYSKMFLKEKITPNKIFGVGLIIVGVFFIGLGA